MIVETQGAGDKMQQYEINHINKIRALSPECVVLLKSDGSFPLKGSGKLALFGNGARRTIKGGTGSGDVNVRAYTTIEEGMKKAGFTITTAAWMDRYDDLWTQAHKEFVTGIKSRIAAKGLSAILLGLGAVMNEPEYELPLDGEGDTAIYVLARVSGEGSDRQAITGDFQMSQLEIRDINTLTQKYRKFMLVLNVGGVVDLTPVVEQVPNILLLSQLGTATGDVLADIILGHSYPSGKLTATWAKWDDYCHIGDFGEEDDTRYREGIYVGYRYFDTVGKQPLFPFGYGLGYSDFEITAEGFEVEGTTVRVQAKVKNIGIHCGKEVVQLYVSVPSHKLDQPYQVLTAFEKTDELPGGAGQKVGLTFDMRDLASFDEAVAALLLESGNYVLRLGNSSRNTQPLGAIRLDETVEVQKLSHAGGIPDFTDWKPERCVTAKELVLPIVKRLSEEDFLGSERKHPEINAEALEMAKGMSDSELAYLCTGSFVDEGSSSVVGNAGMTVAGAAGETTGRFKDRGIIAMIMADGPAGLRLSRQYGVDEKGVYSLDQDAMAALYELIPEEMLAFLHFDQKEPEERTGRVYEQYCTAIPIGTAIAQSWNIRVARECGDIVGNEMERFGVHLWLAPALNIHRLPLCGRNFEYYSEDPLISGKIAAAITKGTQAHPGCGVTVKHFVGNNQETNRFHSNSVVSQRALRDIYMKGFEIVIKEAAPYTLMSSYNLLNGEHTSQRYDLMETVLRDEWGFGGIVMSDWISDKFDHDGHKYPGACAHGAIKAGNDIMMPGTRKHYEDLLNALNNAGSEYPLTRAHLEKCAARMIALTWKLTEK